jgi:hypothetical protein
MLKPGDLVVIVGTRGRETEADERGKILGLMEPTTEPVSSLEYALSHRPQHFNEDGEYRWPFGLELKHAWSFIEPRARLADLSSRRFNLDAAQGIVPLEPSEANAILALPRAEIELLRPIQAVARIEGIEAARRRAAPPPAYTYAMAVVGGGQPTFKIGWAFDVRIRQLQFNSASLPLLGGLRYKAELTQLWPTAFDAFCMEQSLLRTFDRLRHRSNREVVVALEFNALQDEWVRYLREHRAISRPRLTSS